MSGEHLFWHCLQCGDHEPVQPTGGDEEYAIGDHEPCITCGEGTARVMTLKMGAFYEQGRALGMSVNQALARAYRKARGEWTSWRRTMRINVLDHGYVEAVEHWGSDERIIEAARMSTGKGFLGWGPKEDGAPGDERLLRYLYENHHATPFEMAGLVVEVQAPIFVFREWHRHRTQSYNEMSARYVPLPDVNYVPSVERIESGWRATRNRQAAGVAQAPDEAYPHEHAERFRAALEMQYREAETVYRASLASGVPKELARLCVPVGRYSRMRAAANLRNWLAFLTLRMAPNAQWEIRQYADAVGAFLSERFPRTWQLFVERRPTQ